MAETNGVVIERDAYWNRLSTGGFEISVCGATPRATSSLAPSTRNDPSLGPRSTMGLFAAKQRENQPVMASKTDEQIAKENRLRLFRQDGARAMEDAADEAVVVRKNMERLRELRLAQEAEAASSGQTAPKARPVKPPKSK